MSPFQSLREYEKFVFTLQHRYASILQTIYWYDPQPHPNDPYLASTHPHHKHVPPDTADLSADAPAKRSGIKRNRIPAPAIRFDRPNLPFLIEEVESLIQSTNHESQK